MKKQKIFIISVGRSDYDRYYPIINELNNKKNVNLYIVVTKSHCDSTFGNTINFIDKKFKILKNNYRNNKIKNLTDSFAEDLFFLNNLIKKHKPKKILVLGDRYEMLIGPVAALPYNIPVIHFFGGAVTLGATDELVRHAITKMSHFHFPLLPVYKNRILQMGEEKWRVKNIGMHELNHLKKIKILTKESLKKIFKFNFSSPFMLVTFHPTTLELKNLDQQLKSLYKAIILTKTNAIITYPNADPQNKKIIKFMKKNFSNQKKFLLIKNCGKRNFASLLKICSFVLGNSSSGVVEAASFKIPAINIGTRQDGKFKPLNVINCTYKHKDIMNAINKAQSINFRQKLLKMKNPYEEKIKIKKIVDLIIKIKNNDKILRKKFKDLWIKK